MKSSVFEIQNGLAHVKNRVRVLKATTIKSAKASISRKLLRLPWTDRKRFIRQAVVYKHVTRPTLTRYQFFFITRASGVSYADWTSAVDSCARARVNPDDESLVQVFHPDGKWRDTFSWRVDSASYSHPLRYPAEHVAKELAEALNASICSQPKTNG